jgi:SAM-dependent methyltransferase
LNRDFIARHWYAGVYEQFENQTNDVDYLLKVIQEQTDGTPQNILEVACGGGRICIPLAQAGHTVTGFDTDEHMLLRCYRRMQGLNNIRCFAADAITADWGGGFDIVVMAGNILINIELEMDYAQAQVAFINKAAKALRMNGHLYLDFDLLFDPMSFFSGIKESSYFSGTDDMGTSGRTVSYGSVYDPVTQICAGVNHWELTTNNGDAFIIPMRWYKHIPAQAQVFRWLAEAGFTIERTYMNYTDKPLPEPITESTYRATIWARKN